MAEKILASRGALEGERKLVTVLFADLKGSTELIQGRDPEEVQGLLDGAVKCMMEAVHRYEGTVNQILGDGIMALFGAPLAHEDHAVRACFGALAMQESVRRYADQVRARSGVEVQARVGLNSGEVVVRAIANDLRMDYSALGQTTHLAARMEQTAEPGTIRLTPATLRLAEGFVEARPLGPVPIKGFSEPLEVFELIGSGTARSRLDSLASRGLSRFVGREAELEAFRQALGRAAGGRGQVVALVGEPGVGKSRLVRESTDLARAAGWRVLQTGALSYGTSTPYLPIADLLRTYFRIEARDDPASARRRVSEGLLGLDPALERDRPALLALLDLGADPATDSAQAAWLALDPLHRRRLTLEAVRRLLLRESREQPLLLVFEDLHWVDSETQALLDSLVESLPAARLLLLVNYRPEYSHRWANKTYYTQLRLDPLPSDSAEALLRALLGDDAGLDSLRRLLIDQTEGNPLFLEESVRTLVETRALVGERGAYRLARAPSSIEVPATVQAVLAARIDRLPPEEKRLLQSAAVIGKDVPFPLLQAIADDPVGAPGLAPEAQSRAQSLAPLQEALTHLQAAEFLYEASLFPELEYTFKHALTHDVSYRGLLQERRRALHARIVEAIELLHAGRLEEQVERLAQHALRGEVWHKALAYWRQAGLKALGHSVHREAAAAFEQALLALEHLPETRDLLEQAIDIRLDFPRTLIPLGEIERLLDRLNEAETIAERLDDRRRLGRIAAFQTGGLWWLSQFEPAIAAGRRALAIAEPLGDVATRIVASYYLAMSHFVPGDCRRGAEVLRPTVALLTGNLVRERFGGAGYPASMTRAWLAWCLAELGEFDEALALGREAVGICEQLDHPYSLTHACLELGGVHLRRGEPDQAIPVLERGLALSRTWEIPVFFAGLAGRLALAYALAGRDDEAPPLLTQAIEQASTGRPTYPVRAHWMALASEVPLLAGRPDDGLAEHALALAREHNEPGNEAWLLRLLGQQAARRDPPGVESAEASYRQALALAEDLGLRPLQAHCHLELGTLYRRVGRPDEARTELSRALDLLRAMAMAHWIPLAEAELQAASVHPGAEPVS